MDNDPESETNLQLKMLWKLLARVHWLVYVSIILSIAWFMDTAHPPVDLARMIPPGLIKTGHHDIKTDAADMEKLHHFKVQLGEPEFKSHLREILRKERQIAENQWKNDEIKERPTIFTFKLTADSNSASENGPVMPSLLFGEDTSSDLIRESGFTDNEYKSIEDAHSWCAIGDAFRDSGYSIRVFPVAADMLGLRGFEHFSASGTVLWGDFYWHYMPRFYTKSSEVLLCGVWPIRDVNGCSTAIIAKLQKVTDQRIKVIGLRYGVPFTDNYIVSERIKELAEQAPPTSAPADSPIELRPWSFAPQTYWSIVLAVSTCLSLTLLCGLLATVRRFDRIEEFPVGNGGRALIGIVCLLLLALILFCAAEPLVFMFKVAPEYRPIFTLALACSLPAVGCACYTYAIARHVKVYAGNTGQKQQGQIY